MTTAECYIDLVELSDYVLPGFTGIFKQALKDLNRASSQGKAAQKKAFKRFYRYFGTHYAESSTLGARIMITTYLTEKARHSFTQDQLRKCGQKGISLNILGWKYSNQENSCSNSDTSKLSQESEYVSKLVIHSYGSTPTTALTDWAKQEFAP